MELDDDDLIISNDLDEIPNLEINFKYKNNITIFEQKMFYFKLNLILSKIILVRKQNVHKKKNFIISSMAKKYKRPKIIQCGD